MAKKKGSKKTQQAEEISRADEKDLSNYDIKELRRTISRLEEKITLMEEGIQRTKLELENAKTIIQDERKKLENTSGKVGKGKKGKKKGKNK